MNFYKFYITIAKGILTQICKANDQKLVAIFNRSAQPFVLHKHDLLYSIPNNLDFFNPWEIMYFLPIATVFVFY